MKRMIGLIFASLLLASPALAEPIRRAVYADNRLWLLHDGAVFSLSETSVAASTEMGAGTIADLCVSAGRPTVVTQSAGQAKGWQIRQRVDGAWTTVAKLKFDGAPLNAFACDDTRVIAVFNYGNLNATRMVVVSAGQVDDGRLNGMVRPGEETATLIAGHFLYIGINAGEWGGGLQRINLEHWLVESIDQLDSDDGCAGPLYWECDPVTALSPMPGTPECIALTTGLRHMSVMQGSVVSVCDRKVSLLYDRVLDATPMPSGRPWRSKEVFTSVVAADTNLYAAGAQAIYRIDPLARTGQPLPMLEFRRIGGFTVSFALPGLVIVNAGSDVDAPNLLLVAKSQQLLQLPLPGNR